MNRRILLPGLLLLSVTALVSCEREMEAPAGNTITIKASLDAETKTTYAGEKSFSWVAGDRISLTTQEAGTLGMVTLETAGSGPSVDFTGDIPLGAKPAAKAFYPETFAQLADGEVRLALPEEMTPDPANPLSAVPLIGTKQEGNSYAFRTATGILKITLSDIPADATAVVLSHESADVVLAGTFALPEGDGLTPQSAVSAKQKVTLLFTPAADGESRSFYFPLPAQEIPAGLTLSIRRSTLAEDQVLGVTGAAVEVRRNGILNLSALGAEAAGMLVAYIQPATKTAFDAGTGQFSWLSGDEIDAVVRDKENVYSGRRYSALDAGLESRFALVEGEKADDLVLTGWAFYPSRENEAAQNGGYALQWGIRSNYYPADQERWPDETELITVDLPSHLAHPTENPMGTIPLLGVRQDDFRYRFAPMTGIVAVRMTDMTDALDFISITGTGALSGSFHLDQATGSISQESALSASPDGLTIHFSGVGADETFYFPVPAGTIENFTLTVGSSLNSDESMVKTASSPVTVKAGEMLVLNASFEPKDLQWEVVSDAVRFVDDFMWSMHSAYTADTPVTVTLERSGLHPEKYRINNPYTVANAQFGYTPYTEGIVADPYLVFWLNDDGIVRFNRFRLGIEDRDSGGRPMMITHPLDWSSGKKGIYNKVVSALKDGTPLEIELAPMYSDPNDSGHFYSRDNEGSSTTQRIHISIPDDAPESWEPVAEGEFVDELIWSLQGWGTAKVPVTLEQSSKVATSFRIANPYLAAKEQFSYVPYENADDIADYIYITLKDNNLLSFNTFNAGIEDKPSGGHQMRIWYPSQWGGSYDVSYNKVLEWRSDGLPARFQFAVVYSGTTSSLYSYKYTKNTAPSIFFSFPEAEQPQPEEEWTPLGEAHYRDKFLFANSPYAGAQLDRSNLGRYRLANPYPALAAQTGTTLTYTPDDYLYFTIADSGLIDFDEMVTGMEKVDGGYGWSVSISHPKVLNKNINYNKVLTRNGAGEPESLQLAPIYHESGDVSSKYKYSRDYYDDMIRILMPGVPSLDGAAVVTVRQYPLMPAFDNPVETLSLPSGTLEKLVVKMSGLKSYAKVTGVRLYQGGWMNDDYVSPDASGTVVMTSFSNATVSGDIDLNFRFEELAVGTPITFTIQEVVVDGQSLEIHQDVIPHLSGVVVNHGGDKVTVRNGAEETVASFRIPALVTTTKGTLIAAYDVRYDSSVDLQGDIDVGFKRSTDGGKTWSDLGLAMDLGIWGYEDKVAAGEMSWKDAQKLNGIGDPCLLVDENTGEIFCFAVWAHDHANSRCIYWAGTGFDPVDTPQLMMVRSTDDGLTWSEPINLTRQIKRFDWMMSFQGPGRGITMKDGTLVIPFQHQEGSRSLNSGIMYSSDHGRTWHTHAYAHPVTSESAVAEIEPGVLLLTMRDETNSHYRRNFTTSDLGRTWQEHASNGKLVEPTCEASLIHVDAADNGLGKDLLLFSNPASSSGRNHITIKASLDKGVTWEHELLLDAGGALGYSCLTMIDKDTVGILYECSKGNIFFQAVPLTAIVRE